MCFANQFCRGHKVNISDITITNEAKVKVLVTNLERRLSFNHRVINFYNQVSENRRALVKVYNQMNIYKPDAVTQTEVFLTTSQNLLQNTCVRFWFLRKIAGLRAAVLLKNRIEKESCKIFQNTFFIDHLWWLLLKSDA